MDEKQLAEVLSNLSAAHKRMKPIDAAVKACNYDPDPELLAKLKAGLDELEAANTAALKQLRKRKRK